MENSNVLLNTTKQDSAAYANSVLSCLFVYIFFSHTQLSSLLKFNFLHPLTYQKKEEPNFQKTDINIIRLIIIIKIPL